MYCRQFQNSGSCNYGPENCRFVHASKADERGFSLGQPASPALLAELNRAMVGAQFCRHNAKGRCNRPDCRFSHQPAANRQLWSCPICLDVITAGSMQCFDPCQHVLCRGCATTLIANRLPNLPFECAVCRTDSTIVQLN